MSLLGLDLGGSGAKAAVFDAEGKMLAQAKSQYSVVSPKPGWLEFDPAVQWESMRDAIQHVSASEAVDHDPIRALGISVAGEAVLPVDKSGRPLYNSIATPDPRGLEQIGWWEKELGAEKVYQITGQPLDGFYSFPRMLWFREFMPEVWERASRFLLWQEYLLVRMGVEPALDYSNASRTMGFDIGALAWSDEILEITSLSPELLAPLVPSGTVVGTLDSKNAAGLGLPPGVLVVSGGFDQCCAGLGAGLISEGVAFVGSGSVEALAVVSRTPMLADGLRKAFFSTHPHTASGLYVTLGTNFTAGSLFEWYAGNFACCERREAEESGRVIYDLITAGMPRQPSALLVLPHFDGGFSPTRDPASKGAILGLKTATTRGEFARALLEGTAFELRRLVDCLEAQGCQIREFRNAGGAAKSEVWLGIKADVLNRPVGTLRVNDSACLGAAILAGLGAGEFRNITSAVEAMVHVEKVYEPDRKHSAIYEDRYGLYKELYDAVAPFNHRL